ncbi:AbrB/MazE/SpoVT family DNA-binding domain-containing protein [candidate division KSB1 bacterium]
MKRSIVQHGASSLTVTLPSGWVKKFGLKKGDEVNVTEKGPSVVISTEHETETEKKTVDTTDFGLFTKNNLTHVYMLGYDEVEITFDDEKTLQEIKKRVPECIGFEIIDQKPNKVFIKSIATALESEFDVMLRKSFLVTIEMGKEILEALKKKDYGKLKELRHLESINNRFTICCARILNKRGYKNPKRTNQMYEIVKNIERATDEYKHICDIFSEENKDAKNTKLSKEILDLFAEVNDYYYTFYQLFYKFQPELKKKVYLDRKKLIEKGKQILVKSKGKETLLIHYLINFVNRTYDIAGPYFALIL